MIHDGTSVPMLERDRLALDLRRRDLVRLRLRWALADRAGPAARPATVGARRMHGRPTVLAALLAAVLTVSVLPGVADAQDPSGDPSTTTTTTPVTSSTSTPSTTTPSSSTTSTTQPEETTTTTAPSGPSTTVQPPEPEDPEAIIESGLAGFDVLSKEELELLQKYQDVLSRLNAAQQELIDADDAVVASQSELLSAQTRLRSAEDALAKVEDRLITAQAELEVHEARLQEIAVSAYVGGGRGLGAWASLLKAQSVDELTRGRIYANAIADDQQGTIDRARQLRDQIGGLTRAAEDYENEMAQARDDRSATTEALEQQRLQKAQATADAEAALREQTEVLLAIEDERGNFLNRIAAATSSGGGIEQTLAARQLGQVSPVFSVGIFHPPVRNYKLTSLFGYRVHPLYGATSFHAGLDMALPTGEPVRAAEDGEVVIAGGVGGYGNTVVIDHGNALGTLYGHSSVVLVEVGQKVKRGQVIALVGSTGNSTGPHVHWEVRVHGRPADPMIYLGRDDGN